jgi:hypothetical protein
MPGPSRPKDGVASARLCPSIHVFVSTRKKVVDGRVKPGHDGGCLPGQVTRAAPSAINVA